MNIPQNDIGLMKLCKLFIGSSCTERVCVYGFKKIYATDSSGILELDCVGELDAYLRVKIDALCEDAQITKNGTNYFLVSNNKTMMLATVRPPAVHTVYKHSLAIPSFVNMLNQIKSPVYPQLDVPMYVSLFNKRLRMWVDKGTQCLGISVPNDSDCEFHIALSYPTVAHTRKVLSAMSRNDVLFKVNTNSVSIEADDVKVHIPCKKGMQLSHSYRHIGVITRSPVIDKRKANIKLTDNVVVVEGEECGDAKLGTQFMVDVDILRRLPVPINIYELEPADGIALVSGNLFCITKEVVT